MVQLGRKKDILNFVITWMNSEHIMLSEISQTEKDECYMTSFICGTLKKPNLQKQRMQWWLPGAEAGGTGWMLFKGINLQ